MHPSSSAADDSAEGMLSLVQDRDRIVAQVNDVVVSRLFSAGLSLERRWD